MKKYLRIGLAFGLLLLALFAVLFNAAFNKSSKESKCFDAFIVLQGYQLLVYEVPRVGGVVTPEQRQKLLDDKRKVADEALIHNNATYLTTYFEGPADGPVSELSFGYKIVPPKTWCRLYLSARKIESGRDFYEKLSSQ